MALSTKERILNEALVCFANYGYKGTNLRDLASNLGLSKSALYRHFSSKEELWRELLIKVDTDVKNKFNNKPSLSQFESVTGLYAYTMQLVNVAIHDSEVIMARKLLVIEQFHDEQAREMAVNHFLDGIIKIFADILEAMMKEGTIKEDNAEILAFSYVTPIFALIQMYDRQPEKEREIIHRIEEFVLFFIKDHRLLV